MTKKSTLILLLASLMFGYSAVNAQQILNNGNIQKVSGEKEVPQAAKVEKNDLNNPLLNPNNKLGLTAAENAINKASALIKQNRIQEAKSVIEPAFDWLSIATEGHMNLYKALKEVDTAKAQTQIEKDLALKYAVLRDKASYQLALVYIQEKKPAKAVEKLVNVVRSQPKTPLGFSAYQLLQQIGFTYKAQINEAEAQIENNSQ